MKPSRVLQAALAAVEGPATSTPASAVNLPALVRELGHDTSGLVSLADLRDRAGLPRAEFDRLFLAAWRAGQVSAAALELAGLGQRQRRKDHAAGDGRQLGGDGRHGDHGEGSEPAQWSA